MPKHIAFDPNPHLAIRSSSESKKDEDLIDC
jgi:hypothetical protein